MMILKFDCFLKTLWYTFTRFIKTGETIPVMGHVYDRHEVYRNCVVQISYCEHCNSITIAWNREGNISDEDLLKMYGTINSDIDKGKFSPYLK